MVSVAWNWKIQGSHFFFWEEKLRGLKKELKDWAKLLKSPSSKIKEAHDSLEIHQMILEDFEVTQEQLHKEVDLQKHYHRACREDEEYWRLKSRSLWLQARDKNTSYFRKQAEACKHFKAVNEIYYQNTLVKDFEGIKRASHSFFEDIFSAP